MVDAKEFYEKCVQYMDEQKDLDQDEMISRGECLSLISAASTITIYKMFVEENNA